MPKINALYEIQDYKKAFQSENEYAAFRAEWNKVTAQVREGMKRNKIVTIPLVKKEGENSK